MLELADNYGVTDIAGFRDGYRGLVSGADPLRLTHDLVEDIHNKGGTILGTSRGNQDPAAIVETLRARRVAMLGAGQADTRPSATAHQRGRPASGRCGRRRDGS